MFYSKYSDLVAWASSLDPDQIPQNFSLHCLLLIQQNFHISIMDVFKFYDKYVSLNDDATPISNFQPIRLFDLDCRYKFTYLMANSADPDQLASSKANWSGSTLFAKAGHIQVQ